MTQIRFIDCKELGFKQVFSDDEVFDDIFGFEYFTMCLELPNLEDDLLLSWCCQTQKVQLYVNDNLKRDFEITDFFVLRKFIDLYRIHKNILTVINIIKKTSDKDQMNSKICILPTKKTISELIEISDGTNIIYLQKENEKTTILNKSKQKEFVFTNPEISIAVCKLIQYVFDNNI